MFTKQELALKAIEAAEKQGVDPAVVCSIIEVSSGWDASKTEWNPTRWLSSTHSVDVGGQENWRTMGLRWGLMQVLGQDAFIYGYGLAATRTLEGSLEVGCKLLKDSLDKQGSITKAILFWFGAERRNLAAKTLAILPQYKKFVEERPCIST